MSGFPDFFRTPNELSAALQYRLARLPPRAGRSLLHAEAAGFLCVKYTSAVEMALRQLVIMFAESKHKLLQNYVAADFEKTNARVKYQQISEILRKLDVQIRDDFQRRVQDAARALGDRSGQQVWRLHDSVITWRHGYVHEGTLDSSFQDVLDAAPHCQTVVACVRCALGLQHNSVEL